MGHITDAVEMLAISTMKPRSERSWVFRIVAGSILREGVKLIEREERAKICYPDPLFGVVPRKLWNHSQSADCPKFCSISQPWMS